MSPSACDMTSEREREGKNAFVFLCWARRLELLLLLLLLSFVGFFSSRRRSLFTPPVDFLRTRIDTGDITRLVNHEQKQSYNGHPSLRFSFLHPRWSFLFLLLLFYTYTYKSIFLFRVSVRWSTLFLDFTCTRVPSLSLRPLALVFGLL